jgi:hypothetical protein
MNDNKDSFLGVLAIAAAGLGAYLLLKGKTVTASGGGASYAAPGGAAAGNSDSYPYQASAEGSGTKYDTAARAGYGETPSENLFTTIPDEQIPLIGGGDSWYDRRDIGELLDISPEAYYAGYQELYGEKVGGTGAGLNRSELSAEWRYAYGFSPTIAQGQQDVIGSQVIAAMGGRYVNGELQTPAGYGGNPTQWLKEVAQPAIKAAQGAAA